MNEDILKWIADNTDIDELRKIGILMMKEKPGFKLYGGKSIDTIKKKELINLIFKTSADIARFQNALSLLVKNSAKFKKLRNIDLNDESQIETITDISPKEIIVYAMTRPSGEYSEFAKAKLKQIMEDNFTHIQPETQNIEHNDDSQKQTDIAQYEKKISELIYKVDSLQKKSDGYKKQGENWQSKYKLSEDLNKASKKEWEKERNKFFSEIANLKNNNTQLDETVKQLHVNCVEYVNELKKCKKIIMEYEHEMRHLKKQQNKSGYSTTDIGNSKTIAVFGDFSEKEKDKLFNLNCAIDLFHPNDIENYIENSKNKYSDVWIIKFNMQFMEFYSLENREFEKSCVTIFHTEREFDDYITKVGY